MKKTTIYILKVLSRVILKKYKPRVIAITGSVGKTSAKEAIFSVLSFKFSVRKNIKNYNSEFGVPLTVIGVESGGRSVYGWLRVLYRAFKLIVFKAEYPEVLVLEMGADRPGDIEYLLEFVPVEVGVLTAISEAHLKEFKNVENVQKEKEKVVTRLSDGRALLNIDNDYVREVLPKIKCNYYTYGFSEDADIRAREMSFVGLDQEYCELQSEWDCRIWGTSFKATYDGSTVPFFLPHVLGKGYVQAALSAIGVGLHFEMNLVDISESLRTFRAVPGRLNLLAGIKRTLLIDDTYNASPEAVKTALELLDGIEVHGEGRKIVVLGDMLELGRESEELHKEVGRAVAELNPDLLYCVGEDAKFICQGAHAAGLSPDRTRHFDDAAEAGLDLQDYMRINDMVLIKASRGMHLEKIVKEVMAEPLRAEELLVS